MIFKYNLLIQLRSKLSSDTVNQVNLKLHINDASHTICAMQSFANACGTFPADEGSLAQSTLRVLHQVVL